LAKVRLDFRPGAVPGEREAVEAGVFPIRVHGCTITLNGMVNGNYDITIEGPDDKVYPLLARAGYNEGEWTVG
jgi:hypothetical protein